MKKYSFATFLYFGLAAIVGNFYYPYLNQAIGLDIVEMAKIISLGSAISIFAQPFIGAQFTKVKSQKNFMLKYFFLIILVVLAMFIVDKRSIIMFAPFYGIIIMPMIGTYEMYVENISIKESFQYSEVRKWGSVGVAVITLLSGMVISNMGFKGLHFVALSLLIIFFIIVFMSFPELKNKAINKKISYKVIFKNKDIVLVLVMCFLGVGSYIGIDFAFSSYLVTITKNIDTANKLFSISLSIRSLLEFVSFSIIGIYLINANIKKAFLSVFILILIKFILLSTTVLPLILIGDQLHSILFPLFLVFVFKYLRALEENQELISASYSLVCVFIFGLPNFIFPTIFGVIQKNYGYTAMYICCGSLTVLTLIIGILKLPAVKNNILSTYTKV